MKQLVEILTDEGLGILFKNGIEAGKKNSQTDWW